MERAREAGARAFIERKDFNQSHIIVEGDTIYSYGRHFAMAFYDGDAVYVNEDGYSRTTAAHMNALKTALSRAGYAPVEGCVDKGEYTFRRWERRLHA